MKKLIREGEKLLKKFLRNHLKQLENMEARSEGLEKRLAFKNEIEKFLFTQEFFISLDPRENIQF